jgi:RNA polymerase sigma factor for flagellar operon FliA
LGRAPRPQELADALGLDLDEFWRWREDAAGRSMVGFDERVNGDPGTDGTRWRDTIADEDAVDPGHAVVRGETLSGMREAMAALAEKDRTVLALYYYENLNLRQIGEVLHVTESRVSQIRTRALQRLRQALAADEED